MLFSWYAFLNEQWHLKEKLHVDHRFGAEKGAREHEGRNEFTWVLGKNSAGVWTYKDSNENWNHFPLFC